MDKQPFYGILAKNDAGKRPGVMLACGITEPCPAFANPDQRCTGCIEYALVDPQELATLESQVATANAAAAAMREALELSLAVMNSPSYGRVHHAMDSAEAALSSSAGKAMLARVKHLEAIAEAAVECRKTAQAIQVSPPRPDRRGQLTLSPAMQANIEANKRFHAAIDAIDPCLKPKSPDDDPGSDNPEAPGPAENEPKEAANRG